jgi:hypothetical protein
MIAIFKIHPFGHGINFYKSIAGEDIEICKINHPIFSKILSFRKSIASDNLPVMSKYL